MLTTYWLTFAFFDDQGTINMSSLPSVTALTEKIIFFLYSEDHCSNNIYKEAQCLDSYKKLSEKLILIKETLNASNMALPASQILFQKLADLEISVSIFDFMYKLNFVKDAANNCVTAIESESK